MLSSRPVALVMDSHVYPSKTPGRIKGRAENAIPMNVHGKGKEIMMQTPFHGGKQATLAKAPMTGVAQGKQNIVVSRPNVRILGDKTPFPNRSKTEKFETSATQLSKLPVLLLLEPNSHLPPDKTPDSQLRPSSARKQDRMPRLSAGKAFVTPINNGNHWDVSELNIVAPETEVQETPADDYDEIEYMPPNTLYLASQPALDIELPDYKQVGKALFNFAQTCPYNDSTVAEIVVLEEDVKLPGWDMLPLQELESDDPFRQFSAKKSIDRMAPTVNRKVISDKKSIPVVSKAVPPARLPESALHSRPTYVPRMAKNTIALSTQPMIRKVSTIAGPSGAPSNIRSRSIVQAAKAVGQVRSTNILRPDKPAAKAPQGIPSRPATSAATRNRPISSLATGVARRPVTSTSQYKITSVPRSGLNMVVPSNGNKEGGRDDVLLLVDGGISLDEDFRFNV
ncbi:hypothetical protein H0H87_003274 [Tephrocybe sp. NHM501043]|nr:hypothetical protein H0H87_003274 [Tephrocybe sp. NHM501043]